MLACEAILRELKLTIRQPDEFRNEVLSRIEISLTDESSSESTPRELIAGCLIDMLEMGADYGGHYDGSRAHLQREGLWAEYLTWQSQLREATRLLNGEFSAEYGVLTSFDHN